MTFSVSDRFSLITPLREERHFKTFLVDDRLLDRQNVILKIIKRDCVLATVDDLTEHFAWQIGFEHCQFATVLDAGFTKQQHVFYVREHLEASKPLSADPIATTRGLVTVVNFLFRNGRIHGALKPSNIFVHKNGLTIADPKCKGIRVSEDDQYVHFGAPELLRGADLTRESDLYSLGAILYWVFTGRHLFEDSDLNRLRSKYQSASVPPAPCIAPVSQAVLELAMGLLDGNPDQRAAAFERLTEAIGCGTSSASNAIFLGRQRLLQQTFEMIHPPEPSLRVCLIEGEWGIGKSRFIAQLRLLCSFRRLAFDAWHVKENSHNLSPIKEGLRRLSVSGLLSSRLRTELDRLVCEIFGSSIKRGVFPTESYPIEKAVSEIVRVLALLTRNVPFVIAIDDCDYADHGTLLLLQQLVYRSSEMSMTLILTRRPSEPEPSWIDHVSKCLSGHFVRHFMPPLSLGETQTLVRLLESDEVRRNNMVEYSAGNPMFIHGYASCTSPIVDDPPEIIQRKLGMLSALDSDTRYLLQVLSVLRKPIDLSIVARLCRASVEQLRGRLGAAERRGLINNNAEMIAIRFPAVRQRLYRALTKNKRVHLNSAVFLALRGTELDLPTLATYAFEGELFEEAAGLYYELARTAYDASRFQTALDYYIKAQKCQSGQPGAIDLNDKLQLAHCYDWLGKQRIARELYQEILSSSSVVENPELTSLVYARLATSFDKTAAADDRLRFINLAIECLPSDSPSVIRRYGNLLTALVRIGRLESAAELLAKVEEYVVRDKQEMTSLHVFRGFLLHARGEFRLACDSYLASLATTARALNEYETQAILLNLAVCCENLGDLKTALDYQVRAKNHAEASRNVPLRILSDGNLGAIKMKLGAFREASQLFAQAHTDLNTWLSAASDFDRNRHFLALQVDSILHAIYRAEYKVAGDRLKRVRIHLGPPLELERMFYEIIRCKFFLEIGLTGQVLRVLRDLTPLSIYDIDFLRVEWTLIEARLREIPPTDKMQKLQEACVLSEKLETLYQRCELFIALATVCLDLGQRQNAIRYVKMGLELANKNSYRLLATRAAFVLGMTADQPLDRQHFLSDAFHEASEMGLQELVAESAYHLGTHHLENGNTITAREYLIRSSTLTARLAEGVPLAARSKYLAKQWRRDARAALERCNELIPFNAAAAFNTDADKYFGAAYRFTTAVGAVNSVEGLLRAVETTLESAFSRCAMVTLQIGTNTLSMPVRVKSVPEFTQHLELLRSRAKGRVFFDSIDDKGKQPHAWIPLNSETCDGGIYVFCRPHESSFTEKEIELLVMMGTIANGALKRLETRNAQEAEPEDISEFHGIIGASKAIKNVYAQIQVAANNAATVLIEGESGTGKELVAKAIHAAGARAKGPFIAVDCGAIPEGLIEAELFGAKKGSYTGADTDRPGLFEAANRGTIFLDEISNTPMTLQVKMLRVIQEREVRRLGETKGRSIDVRLIVASNDDLEALSEAGKFRKDLFYRLKVLHIKVPPLRSRADDIPMLAHSFLQKLNASNKTRKYFAPDVVPLLSSQKFPGNVRELQNTIERAFFMAKGIMITEVPLNAPATLASGDSNDVKNLFKDIADGREDFWSGVRNRYKRRDISREKIRALVDFGLRTTGGSYKDMVSQFRLKDSDYRRFMDFLRRNDCLLDFRPYRKATNASREN